MSLRRLLALLSLALLPLSALIASPARAVAPVYNSWEVTSTKAEVTAKVVKEPWLFSLTIRAAQDGGPLPPLIGGPYDAQGRLCGQDYWMGGGAGSSPLGFVAEWSWAESRNYFNHQVGLCRDHNGLDYVQPAYPVKVKIWDVTGTGDFSAVMRGAPDWVYVIASSPPRTDAPVYVALGDSYSSGFGNPSYEPGTNKDAGSNDCQRSESGAYAQTVRRARPELTFRFHACQGGVTRDFFQPRNNLEDDPPFSEPAQLTNVDRHTRLVTFSIGGNDAGFGPNLKACIRDPRSWAWGCRNDSEMTQRVARTFQRLAGLVPPDGKSFSYDEIWQELKLRGGGSLAGVSVGYPHFFPPGGTAARCEGVYPSDQAWIVERIDTLNDIARTQARKHGMRFVDPNNPSLNRTFSDHELCSNDPWIHPVFENNGLNGLHPGRVHPTVAGQSAMAEAVEAALAVPPPPTFIVKPQQTVMHEVAVTSTQESLNVNTTWPGSDVVLTLRSPSGRVISRATQASDVRRDTRSTWERVQVSRPEVGTWVAELYGLDVLPDGEPTTLDVYQEPLPNNTPRARTAIRVEGAELVLDGRSSSDPDGLIRNYDWYIRTSTGERKLSGAEVRIARTDVEQGATLVVTDDRGGRGFAYTTMVPVDVLPGSAENPITLTSKGNVPLALVSTSDFDATTVGPDSLRAGPGAAAPVATLMKSEDVNGDGRRDLVVHFSTQALKLAKTSMQLCVSGTLNVSGTARSFEGCDAIRPKG